MSKEKETDAATALSQMSQLVGIPFDLSTGLSPAEQEAILEADAIGATCTLQPSSLDADMLFSLHDDRLNISDRHGNSDPYISFDDADHPYAVNTSEPSNNSMLVKQKYGRNITQSSLSADSFISFDGAEHPYAASTNEVNGTSKSKLKILNSTAFSASPLTCIICDKNFKTRNALMVHLQFHAGKKPHSCLLCMRPFTTKADLKRHAKVHEKHLEGSFQCEICLKRFRDQATKTRHMKIHNEQSRFKCDHCFKEFSRSDSYKNHLSTHSNSKRYKCDICLSEFNYKSSFNRHLASHSADCMFICDVCGKTFRRLDYVDSHKKMVHSSVTSTLSLDINQKNNLPDSTQKLKSKTPNKSKKRRTKARTKGSNSRFDSINLETREAVPILMSMAEQAANSVFKKPKKCFSEDYSHTNLMNDVPLSSPQIDNDFILYLDDTSNDDMSDRESIASDDLQICIDASDADATKRVSCIVTNPSTIPDP